MKQEICKKCQRKYDGHYPCICGSKKFESRDIIKEFEKVGQANFGSKGK